MMSRDQMKRWKRELLDLRRRKDQYLLTDPSSPIPRAHRSRLEGIPYFDPDEQYFLEVELEEDPKPPVVEIQDTGGHMRKFLRWGHFDFEIGDAECVLYAYKSDPHEDSLFVPFRDKTSGKETYGAGRYMDLYEDRDRTNWGWVLDLNMAYNPYCAYSPNYVCPFVPTENWLEVEIRAGEKDYPLHE